MRAEFFSGDEEIDGRRTIPPNGGYPATGEYAFSTRYLYRPQKFAAALTGSEAWSFVSITSVHLVPKCTWEWNLSRQLSCLCADKGFPSATWEPGQTKRLVCSNGLSYSQAVPRRAVLIFAEEVHRDLTRRAFPHVARPLLNLPAFTGLSPGTDVHLFTSAGRVAQSTPEIHRQSGHDFASRLENAIEKIHALGYDEIVAIGRDCPSLRAADIERAFAELASRRLVLGPDHRGGCYLIAFRSADRALLRDVRWKQNTDCAQLRARCVGSDVLLLPVKHDIDSWNDVRIFARTGDPLARLALFLVRMICAPCAPIAQRLDRALQRMRVRQQMPPPAFAA